MDVEIIGLTEIVRNRKPIVALTNTPRATGEIACNLLADWSQQLIAILLRDSCSKMYTDFTVLSFPVYIVLYLKVYFLCVAYFLGLFSFVSFSVCCGMTLGAPDCFVMLLINRICDVMLLKHRCKAISGCAKPSGQKVVLRTCMRPRCV